MAMLPDLSPRAKALTIEPEAGAEQMTGHIRRGGARSWELKFDVGSDPASGARRVRYHSFKGTKREAGEKLAELVSAVGKGTYVDSSKITLAEYVRARV
jgi:hypothetical protein